MTAFAFGTIGPAIGSFGWSGLLRPLRGERQPHRALHQVYLFGGETHPPAAGLNHRRRAFEPGTLSILPRGNSYLLLGHWTRPAAITGRRRMVGGTPWQD